MELRNFIRKIIHEQFEDIRYEFENNDDGFKITAISKSGNPIGFIVANVLIDSYSYEFEVVFDEDEFYKIFPDDEIVKISHIEISDGFKGHGIAKELMIRMMSLMRKKRYSQFYLNASPMGFSGLSLSSLVSFYKKFGFKELLNQGNNVLMVAIFDKNLNEQMKQRGEVCNNVLCFSRMLQKKKFVAKNDEYKVSVLLSGDGDEIDRTFEIEVPFMAGMRALYDSGKEYNQAVDDYKNYETSVIGWNLNGEEIEWREIFFHEIEDIVQDLNR